MKHRISHLNFNHVDIPLLKVHSYEMGRYLLEVDYNDHMGFVYDEQDRLQSFKSVNQIKDALSECRVKKAFLVHQSAYDEMCGAEEGGNNELQVELNFKH